MRQFTLGFIVGALFGISVTLNTVAFYLLNKLEKDIALLSMFINEIVTMVILASIITGFLVLYSNKIKQKIEQEEKKYLDYREDLVKSIGIIHINKTGILDSYLKIQKELLSEDKSFERLEQHIKEMERSIEKKEFKNLLSLWAILYEYGFNELAYRCIKKGLNNEVNEVLEKMRSLVKKMEKEE